MQNLQGPAGKMNKIWTVKKFPAGKTNSLVRYDLAI